VGWQKVVGGLHMVLIKGEWPLASLGLLARKKLAAIHML